MKLSGIVQGKAVLTKGDLFELLKDIPDEAVLVSSDSIARDLKPITEVTVMTDTLILIG